MYFVHNKDDFLYAFSLSDSKFFFLLDSDIISTMPIELKLQHTNWLCVDTEDKTIILNNVLIIPPEGGDVSTLRLATTEDSQKDEVLVDLEYLGLPNSLKYVKALPEEEIQHSQIYWLMSNKNTPVKMYFPN